MKRMFVLASFLGLGLITSASAATNLLDDPGFEASDGGTQTSNSAWGLDVNFPDLNNPTDGAAQFQDAPWASNPLGVDGHGVWFKAFKGGGNNNWDPANANLSQQVAAGPGTYDLTFYVRHETNFTANAAMVMLSSDQGDSASFDLLNDTANDGAYNQYSITGFVASPGTTTLTVSAFMSQGVDALANPQSLMVDDFSLTQIPEPTSMLLAGMSLLGLMTMRRR